MERSIVGICERIDRLLLEKPSVLVAVDGCCGAGKTTLAALLEQKYGCSVFHMDDYFLRPEQRTPERLAQAGGNVDYERFREEVLLPLSAGEPVCYRPYDCHSRSLKAPVLVLPRRLTIIEGTYSMHPYFDDPYDLKIFLSVSAQLQRERILQRPEPLHRRFFEEWIPMEQTYFDTFHISAGCDMQL